MSENLPIRLRPHHFLCMLTYVGKGYSQSFTENYDVLIKKLNKGNVWVEVVSTPDDICAPRLCDSDDKTCHCYDASIIENDQEALRDFEKNPAFSMIRIGNRFRLTKNLIKELRAAYKENAIRTACNGCEWKSICNTLVQQDFEGSYLK